MKNIAWISPERMPKNAAKASDTMEAEDAVQSLVRRFRNGEKQRCERIGIELEYILVHERDGSQVRYDEPFGIAWILEQLAGNYSEQTLAADGRIIGLANGTEEITLEPAAQLELSAGPFHSLADAQRHFEAFERRVKDVAKPHGISMLSVGFHPCVPSASLTLIPKERYAFMDAHFASIGPWGRRMMRATAATQVSIDYANESDCMRKLKMGYALSPIFALICDNAAMFEARPRPHRMMRTEIWMKCDPSRTGIFEEALQEGFGYETYAKKLLAMPAIASRDEHGQLFATSKTFGELFAERSMSEADIDQVLSMSFHDVRLKTYLEFRSADAMPIPFAIAYAGLIKGTLLSEQGLRHAEELVGNVTGQDIINAKHDLMENGYEASVYGRSVAEIADALFSCALDVLDDSDCAHLRPLHDLVLSRKTLADCFEFALD